MATLRLSDSRALDRSKSGGKAAAVAGLLRAGFDVPPGIVLQADSLAAFDGSEAREREAILEALQGAGLADVPLAVRSSATDEDGSGASFAGQYQTVLGVVGESALWAAISACRASLHADSAGRYREARTAREPAQMAVLIQRMVEALAAGVAFTADPVTGDRDKIVVEAVAGLGEGLVSGAVTADRFIFTRSLETRTITPAGGPDAATSLPLESAREVARLALRAEEAFGTPQDIEFAWDGATVWMLQSRPITRAPGSDERPGEFDSPTAPETLWTNANIQEVLPGLLTPYAMSVFERLARRAYNGIYQRLRVLDRDEAYDFVGTFYSRAYLNVNATRLIADRVIGTSAEAVEHRFLGGDLHLRPPRPHRPRLWWYRVRCLPFLAREMVTVGRSAGRFEASVLAEQRRVQSLPVEALSDAQLEGLRREVLDFGSDVFGLHLFATGLAGAGFDMVSRLIRPVLADQTEGYLPALFTGLPNVESAQIGFDLWQLSRVATTAGLDQAVRGDNFDPADPGLPGAWSSAWRAFLERHGHRGLAEMEPAARSWRQDPSLVLGIVRSYIDLPAEQAPPATFARQERERVRLTNEVAGRMNLLQRAFFRDSLKRAQGWVALRERTKSIVVRVSRIGEFVMPEVQRRMVARGVIGTPDDAFFLSSDEITNFLLGRRDSAITERVAERRKATARHRALRLPERFAGRPIPLPLEPPGPHLDRLSGTPVSPGIVTGPARVILDPSRDGPLRAGEVLVAPVTDAGWTPLFALASGLVVDIGSALSHGSTVAREYGLPAVVNVKVGTQRIRTGDIVTVNGTQGTVDIAPGGGEATSPR